MRTVVLSILLTLFSATVTAEQPAQKTTQQPTLEQIHTLIKRAGLEHQLQQIPAALEQTANAPGNPASSLMNPLLTALLSAYDPVDMAATLSGDLIKRLDVPTLLDAMAWYNSDNARTMLNAQKSATQPDVIDKMSAVLVSQKADITPQRQQLLTRLLSATQANEAALDMMVNLQAAFMSGLGTMIAPTQTQSYQQLRTTFAASKSMMRDQLAQQLLLQQSVVMEPVSDESLNAFLTFADSPSGKKLFTALRASLDYTVQTASLKVPDAVKAHAASSAMSTQK